MSEMATTGVVQICCKTGEQSERGKDMRGWLDIETASRDGSVVRVCRFVDGEPLFERDAVWRRVTFQPFTNGPHGVEPGYMIEAWAYPDREKLVPTPTHWRP